MRLYIFGKGPEVVLSELIFFQVWTVECWARNPVFLVLRWEIRVRYTEFFMYFLRIKAGEVRVGSSSGLSCGWIPRRYSGTAGLGWLAGSRLHQSVCRKGWEGAFKSYPKEGEGQHHEFGPKQCLSYWRAGEVALSTLFYCWVCSQENLLLYKSQKSWTCE